MADAADDIALIRAYRDGDTGAFDLIFARYHQRIRAVCTRYVGDGNLAEDLVQETFYNVLKALHRVEDNFNFSAWIHRIAINLCHDELRRRDKQRHRIEPSSDRLEDVVMGLVDTDPHGHPERALEIAQLRRLVWQVAKRLPERQRLILTLRELQGLSYASIARVMGISHSAVETLLHRARKRFKEEYMAMEAAEDSGDCSQATTLVAAVSTRRLRREERRFVVQHLTSCATCLGRLTPTGAPSEVGRARR